MASGWAADGAELEQIEATINDAIERARLNLASGESAEYCDECDAPIPQARRDALPGVRYCVNCQQQHENSAQQHILYNRRGSKDSQLR